MFVPKEPFVFFGYKRKRFVVNVPVIFILCVDVTQRCILKLSCKYREGCSWNLLNVV